jgi:threonine aldolase
MRPLEIDLFSDTVTRPSLGMRRAMAEAEVGDEQYREDPTTNRLQERVAEFLGKEAALFVPTGTMCNQIAYRIHGRQGDEIICDETAHPIHAETGGPAALSGLSVRAVRGERGIFTAAQVEGALRDPKNTSNPRSRIVSVEQTSNMGGGTVWPLAHIREVAAVARRHRLALHMDGARLLNAVVASGVSAAEFAAEFDTVWIDFTKGLGAPVGAAVAGSREFFDEAWRVKQQLGGAMRQSGVIAAACLYALDHNVERLAEDHANAQHLADHLREIPRITVEDPATNMVFFDVGETGLTSHEFADPLQARGLRLCPRPHGSRIRAVTHLDVSREQIGEAAALIANHVQSIR